MTPKIDAETTIEGLKQLRKKFEDDLRSNKSFIGLNSINSLLQLLESAPSQNTTIGLPIIENYDPTLSQIRKAEYFLRKANKPLTTSEIVDLILIEEPNLNKSKVMGGLSAVLGDYATKKKKIVKRETNKKGELVYSLL